MDVFSEMPNFRCLQEFLIEIHQELLRITKTECTNVKLDTENDYIEKLLECLVTELKNYNMYSKFEKMPHDCRRKELLVLLTDKLGVKIQQNEAGDMGTNSNIFGFNSTAQNCSGKGDYYYKVSKNSVSPCIQHSDKITLYESRKPNNQYVQYQLYCKILDKIQLELNGLSSANRDPVVNVLLTGLYVRLQQQGEFSQLARISIDKKRHHLLRMLAAKLMEKCNQITLLTLIRDSTTEVNDILKRKYGNFNSSPNKLWQRIINIGPRQDLMIPLYNNYPLFITEKFLEYLSEAKENIILAQERIFRAKVNLLKKEALETVESLKKLLQYKKYVEAFLHEYSQQLQFHYDITEKEFYRQKILKRKINEITSKIKKNKILTSFNMKEMDREIQKHEKIVQNLHETLSNVKHVPEEKTV